jgi:hypothetical protein
LTNRATELSIEIPLYRTTRCISEASSRLYVRCCKAKERRFGLWSVPELRCKRRGCPQRDLRVEITMCDDCNWHELLEETEEVQTAGRYEFAHHTLSGIYETVEANEHCTERQRKAVNNIRNSKRIGRGDADRSLQARCGVRFGVDGRGHGDPSGAMVRYFSGGGDRGVSLFLV